jgi:hypothetical protein
MDKKRINVLVIGCGNIGALYDINSKDIMTHCKAFSNNKNCDLTIFDDDVNKAAYISKLYNCKNLNNLENISGFDIISICTPTNTHHSYLKYIFSLNIPVVICEKPISDNLKDLYDLENCFQKSNTKVLVNYFRRFHPSFIKLKSVIKILANEDKLKNIIVRYQRGFLNNCSHAFDLIEFLLEKKLDLDNFFIYNKDYDSFENDPTISLVGSFSNISINFIGLQNVKYSYFEIELFFQNCSIKIEESGNIVKFYNAQFENKTFFLPLSENRSNRIKNAIKNRMKYVVSESLNLLQENKSDNFLTALDLNKRLLTLLNNNVNGKISN